MMKCSHCKIEVYSKQLNNRTYWYHRHNNHTLCDKPEGPLTMEEMDKLPKSDPVKK